MWERQQWLLPQAQRKFQGCGRVEGAGHIASLFRYADDLYLRR
jgi:hypothetical protein